MLPQSWIQVALTIGTLIGAMVVFYFKNEGSLRREIMGSEERLRARIDGVREDVHRLDTRLAVLEDRHERPRTSVPAPSPAE